MTSGDKIGSVIALLAVLFLAVNALSARQISRGSAVRLALLWFGLFGVVVLICWIILHYAHPDLT